ncbi:LOW QUALITY PROTEIN: hypothetical protein HID58_046065 [Brassica napus]|uniref:Uncharacterized protein n=1 Tax=Brassica napus TaxID=3708 RepID=A0ABQ8AVZ4_BRANA|nr:LOW QUALITY PROTEIN: hypothetical protein HID58_046065 [Brassica napus]
MKPSSNPLSPNPQWKRRADLPDSSTSSSQKEEGYLMLMGTLLNLFRDKEVKDACLDSIDIKPVYMVPMSFKIFRLNLIVPKETLPRSFTFPYTIFYQHKLLRQTYTSNNTRFFFSFASSICTILRQYLNRSNMDRLALEYTRTRMSEPEQVKGAIDFVGVINYMEHYVKDKSSSLNQNLHDFNIDMAVEFPLKLYDSYANTPWSLQQLQLYTIAENILSLHQFVRRRPQSSSLEDTKRFKYLSSHIEAMLYSLRAFSVVVDGLDVWSDPYLKRYPKLSARGNTSPLIACFSVTEC